MLPIIELFYSIQGEGIYAGQPSIFIRTSGCNLRCVFGHTRCDTPYSSFNPEKPSYSEDEALQKMKEIVDKHQKVKHLVITGGEPLLHHKALEEFLGRAFAIKDWIVTIETNGTQMPLNPLARNYKVSLYSISPKLSTSVAKDTNILSQEQIDNHNRSRINPKVLFNIVSTGVPYQMKFVYSGPECIDEIKEIYALMSKHVDMGDSAQLRWWMRNHPNNYTLLMPEGITKEDIDAACLETAEKALENGWGYSDRLHIRIWDTKRGV